MPGSTGIAQSGPQAGFPGSESIQAEPLRYAEAPTQQDQRQQRAEVAAQVRWHYAWAEDDRSPENDIPTVHSNERREHKGMNPARRARPRRNLPHRRMAAIDARFHLGAAVVVPPRRTPRNRAGLIPQPRPAAEGQW